MVAVALVGGIAALALPRTARAQALSGSDVYRSNCGGCHDLYDPESPKRSRQEWDAILTRMTKVRGASLTSAEYAAVLTYLDSFNHPRPEIQWVDAPATTHRAAITPADSGKLPAPWVEVTPGGESTVPWAVQAVPGGKSAVLSPLKGAAEGRLPALIDNSGVMNSGTASVRVELVSGKGAVGAGLVFGFRSPQAFYGVRLAPRDVVLYEVKDGERALVARAGTPVSLKQWHTLAVTVDGQTVTVSLDGKPLPELSRKLTGYRGGRTGLHTQGDTAALFDQWQVTVR